MDTTGIQKILRASFQIVALLGLVLGLTACDPVTWYANEALRTSEVTNDHAITQQEAKIKVRLFRFARQMVVEIEFETLPKERLSLGKTDIQLLSDGKPITNLGFVENFSDASVKKYAAADLKDSVTLVPVKKMAVVFENSKNNVLELQILGVNYKFTAVQ
jgi:hypothetical protein